MSSVDQAVRGGWYELREHLRKPRVLFNFLFPGDTAQSVGALLKEAAKELENAIEGGVLEVKRRRINLLYVELEEAKFSSEVFTRLDQLAKYAAITILIMGIERAYLAGDIPLETDGEDDESEGAGRTAAAAPSAAAENAQDIKQIIADVQQIIAADPSAKMDGAIKNILLQLQRYRNEAETFRKLKEQSSGYRLEMYSKTFAATFQSIFTSIKRNYESYQAQRQGKKVPDEFSLLQDLDTEKWAAVLTQQLEEADRIRSTLNFLSGKHTNLRGPVVEIARRRTAMGELFEAESIVAAEAAGSEAAAWRLNRLMARDGARRLRRLAPS
ncbi:MAG: hypothetical protein EA427_11940 [Spirochaetaceae bacterium]|nr:MAG: hypothetical protein EA427_11940 [Spirochaetaceae bacterium]